MKIRTDFVTNSSSSSFLVCFARVADMEKAQPILDKHKGNIDILTSEQVLKEIERSKWSRWLEYDWAGIDATPSKEYINSHLDSIFVVTDDYNDLEEDEDGYCDYDVEYTDFDIEVVEDITEENGFTDIDIQYGAGRNG